MVFNLSRAADMSPKIVCGFWQRWSLIGWKNFQTGSSQWNSEPNALYGATLAAILDDTPDTNYNHKLQTYPANHQLQFAICQREGKAAETRMAL